MSRLIDQGSSSAQIASAGIPCSAMKGLSQSYGTPVTLVQGPARDP